MIFILTHIHIAGTKHIEGHVIESLNEVLLSGSISNQNFIQVKYKNTNCLLQQYSELFAIEA